MAGACSHSVCQAILSSEAIAGLSQFTKKASTEVEAEGFACFALSDSNATLKTAPPASPRELWVPVLAAVECRK